jgi:hypothetical protein
LLAGRLIKDVERLIAPTLPPAPTPASTSSAPKF